MNGNRIPSNDLETIVAEALSLGWSTDQIATELTELKNSQPNHLPQRPFQTRVKNVVNWLRGRH